VKLTQVKRIIRHLDEESSTSMASSSAGGPVVASHKTNLKESLLDDDRDGQNDRL
jgi:hypothetical protein